MEESALSHRIAQKIIEYESLSEIHVSDAWQQSVVNKISATQVKYYQTTFNIKWGLISLFFILVNTFFLMNLWTNQENEVMQRNKDLQIIGQELFIHSM